MKGKILIALTLILASTNLYSAQPSVKQKLYVKQAEINLISDIDEIVDVSLFNIMMIKIKYPDLDFSSLDKELDKIILKQNNRKLSNKAYLVKLFLRSDVEFDKREIKTFVKNPGKFFEILVSNFKEQLVAENS